MVVEAHCSSRRSSFAAGGKKQNKKTELGEYCTYRSRVENPKERECDHNPVLNSLNK